MASFEHITPEGFRVDGRRLHEPRCIRCAVGAAAIGGGSVGVGLGGGLEADGCAIFELGGTKAVAYVYGPMEMRRGMQQHDRATLSCSLSTASFGTAVRLGGGGTRGRDRQSTERSLWIQQTFEHAILLEQYPRSQIRLYVHLLQSDGAGVAAAINAATLALADAGIPMRDTVSACTAGMLGRRAAVDLSRDEEMAGGAQVTMATLAGARKVSLLEVESKVPEGMFAPLYETALTGCDAIALQMKACLLEHATQSFSLRMSLRSGQKS
mmetsp:Transcript_159228/g.510819  ORF Transcript_159228/g.510819 Transcript_159228/m.510819 type:complete len:268 (+) Transcript_159228:48-851(+)